MKNKIIHVYGNDGGGLYINGNLISDYYTCVQSDIVEALGCKVESIKLNKDWYNNNGLPKKFSDIPKRGFDIRLR